MTMRNWIEIDGDRYPVTVPTARRGIAPPFVPRFSPGVKAFTGGTPPFEAWGQQKFAGGFQQKFSLFEDNEGWFQSHNVNPEWHDRLILTNSWETATDFSSVTDLRFVRMPFKNVFFAYSATTKKIWSKTGSGAWTDVSASLPGTAYTGFLCDTIAQLGTTAYLLFGTQDGYVVSWDGTNFAEVGRPSVGSDNLQNGIYCMASFNSTLYLGGQNGNDSQALIFTYDGSLAVIKFKGYDMNAAARVQTMIRRYVDSDNAPDQLHFTTLSSTNGYYGQHFLYDGASLRELQFWADNAPLCVLEFNSAGTRALYFGMALRGSIWRFTGDYVEALRLDTPDKSYSYGIRSLAQEGKFLVAPILDATNGLSILRYDGGGWWQAEAIGTSITGYAGEGASIGVYREHAFLSLMHSTSKVIERKTGSNYAASGKFRTGLIDGDYRQVDKEWARVKVGHWPLVSGESVSVGYTIEESSGPVGVVEDFYTRGRLGFGLSDAVIDLDAHNATVTGVGAVTYAGKIAGDTHVSASVAYETTVVLVLDDSKSLATLLSPAVEAIQADYDAIDTDDSTAWNTACSTLLSKAVQVFQMDLSSHHSVESIGITYIGWGSTSAQTPGIALSAWNHRTQTWTALGTNSATSASSEPDKTISATISSGLSDYLDLHGRIFVVATARSVAAFSIGADVNTEYISVTNSWSTATHTLYSKNEAITEGTISSATLNVTKSGGTTFAYYMRTGQQFAWESCTPGTPLTFANPGTKLFFKIEMAGTASSPPIFTKVSMTYTVDSSALVSLGTNSVVGSRESIFYFGDSVVSKLLTLELTLAGGGTTTPTVFGLSVEYLVSPDIAEQFMAELRLETNFEYTDHYVEPSTPATKYDVLLALKGSKRRFAVTWIDGTYRGVCSFREGFWDSMARGVNTDQEHESSRLVPVSLIVLRP